MDSTMFAIHPFDVLGVLGFVLYATGYALVSLQILTSEDIAFYLFNAMGAVCVLVSLSASFNLAALLIQLFYLAISIGAIAARLRRPTTARRVHGLRVSE